jgi:hypothetical protein
LRPVGEETRRCGAELGGEERRTLEAHRRHRTRAVVAEQLQNREKRRRVEWRVREKGREKAGLSCG